MQKTQFKGFWNKNCNAFDYYWQLHTLSYESLTLVKNLQTCNKHFFCGTLNNFKYAKSKTAIFKTTNPAFIKICSRQISPVLWAYQNTHHFHPIRHQRRTKADSAYIPKSIFLILFLCGTAVAAGSVYAAALLCCGGKAEILQLPPCLL